MSPEPVEPAPTSANTEPEEPVEPQYDTEQDQPVDSIEVDGSYEYESVSEHSGEARSPPHQPSAKTSDGRNEIPKFPSRAPSPAAQMRSEMANESENTTGQATITQSQLQDLLATIAQLKDQLATQNNSTSNGARGVTPFNSAFGGTSGKFATVDQERSRGCFCGGRTRGQCCRARCEKDTRAEEGPEETHVTNSRL